MITTAKPLVYPDSDGQPIADNTKQFRWIVSIQGELDTLFADNPNVFVAGDLLWYPVLGHPEIRVAPDALVAFGRPKGDRGSYKQWEEANIAPQVVFEVLSPGNRQSAMTRKLGFYDKYGVEEYYIIDPDKYDITGYIRTNGVLEYIEDMNNWRSPRLNIRFEYDDDELRLYRPDERPFVFFTEMAQMQADAVRLLREEEQRSKAAHQRAEDEHRRAEEERQRAEAAEQQVLAERRRAEELVAQLQMLGVKPKTNE